MIAWGTVGDTINQEIQAKTLLPLEGSRPLLSAFTCKGKTFPYLVVGMLMVDCNSQKPSPAALARVSGTCSSGTPELLKVGNHWSRPTCHLITCSSPRMWCYTISVQIRTMVLNLYWYIWISICRFIADQWPLLPSFWWCPSTPLAYITSHSSDPGAGADGTP